MQLHSHMLRVVAFGLVACSADTGGLAAPAGTTEGPGSAGSTGETGDPTSTGAASDAPGTSGAGSSSGGSTSSDSTGAGGSSEGSSSDTGSATADPPADPCADQDDPPPNVGEPGAVNDEPAFIQVYVNNIENLKLADEECAGDWTDLIFYMKSFKPAPDVFLVQQVSDTAQLKVLVDRMSAELPGDYQGVIADGDPWTQGSPCGPEKARQTNAVIFRTGRFTQVGGKHVWQAWANKDDTCVRSKQARTRSVMVKLHDEVAGRDVTVASIHWATDQGMGPDPACAEKNIAEVDQIVHMQGYRGDLVVFGGDFNESDRQDDGDFRAWYRKANGDDGGAFNYRDPVYRACSSDALKKCLDDNWTIGSGRRIDMLFGQDGEGCRARTRRAHTITYDEADAAAEQFEGSDAASLNYSEHRGVRAEFYY